ncbi:MAG: hypothetical protein J2P48_07720 [Alphaproteobacteria bacterium]|nr:hypothetical protein [Alphaproteobacteria bacterium]
MTTRTLRGGASGEVFQANRVPIALIGIGVAWLLANNTGLTGSAAKSERVQSAGRRIDDAVSEPAHGTGDRDPGTGWARQVVGVARDTVASLRDAGGAAVSRAASVAGYAGDARDVAGPAGRRPVEKLDRDPWLFGVAGLVVGASLAALLPPTRMEREIMEQARDGLNSKVAGLGRQAADCLREFGDSATRAVQHRLREGW